MAYDTVTYVNAFRPTHEAIRVSIQQCLVEKLAQNYNFLYRSAITPQIAWELIKSSIDTAAKDSVQCVSWCLAVLLLSQ